MCQNRGNFRNEHGEGGVEDQSGRIVAGNGGRKWEGKKGKHGWVLCGHCTEYMWPPCALHHPYLGMARACVAGRVTVAVRPGP